MPAPYCPEFRDGSLGRKPRHEPVTLCPEPPRLPFAATGHRANAGSGRPLMFHAIVSLTRSYKLIVFDLDGTLSDSFPWFLSVAASVADKHGFRRIDDVQAMRGKTTAEIIQALDVPLWRLPRIARDMRKLKSRSLHEIPLFAGVPEM